MQIDLGVLLKMKIKLGCKSHNLNKYIVKMKERKMNRININSFWIKIKETKVLRCLTNISTYKIMNTLIIHMAKIHNKIHKHNLE